MHTNLYLLISIGILTGFFMRPLNMFVFGKAISLVKLIRSKPLIIVLSIISIMTTFAVTMSTIFLSLKLSGFIPLAENTPTFVVSFFIGGMFWVVYAKRFNHGCRIN